LVVMRGVRPGRAGGGKCFVDKGVRSGVESADVGARGVLTARGGDVIRVQQ
jgi:hypothetical protein